MLLNCYPFLRFYQKISVQTNFFAFDDIHFFASNESRIRSRIIYIICSQYIWLLISLCQNKIYQRFNTAKNVPIPHINQCDFRSTLNAVNRHIFKGNNEKLIPLTRNKTNAIAFKTYVNRNSINTTGRQIFIPNGKNTQ